MTLTPFTALRIAAAVTLATSSNGSVCSEVGTETPPAELALILTNFKAVCVDSGANLSAQKAAATLAGFKITEASKRKWGGTFGQKDNFVMAGGSQSRDGKIICDNWFVLSRDFQIDHLKDIISHKLQLSSPDIDRVKREVFWRNPYSDGRDLRFTETEESGMKLGVLVIGNSSILN